MFKIFSGKSKECTIYSPVEGTCISLGNVKDKMFAEKLLGDGVAFQFKGNRIYAPCDGTIVMIAATKHAIGFKCKNDTEVLLHIGLDTVNLEGKGFKVLINQGDTVKVGDLIVEVDIELMNKNGVDLTTPMIITNTNDFELTKMEESKVKIGDRILVSKRK